jgi:hypothetical protein
VKRDVSAVTVDDAVPAHRAARPNIRGGIPATAPLKLDGLKTFRVAE